MQYVIGILCVKPTLTIQRLSFPVQYKMRFVYGVVWQQVRRTQYDSGIGNTRIAGWAMWYASPGLVQGSRNWLVIYDKRRATLIGRGKGGPVDKS